MAVIDVMPALPLGTMAISEGIVFLGTSTIVIAFALGAYRTKYLNNCYHSIMSENVPDEVLVELKESIKRNVPEHLNEFQAVLDKQGFLTNAQVVSFIKYANSSEG